MSCHAVNRFYFAFKIDGTGASFSLNMWPLRGVLFKVFLQYFALFCRVPGAMQQACFLSGRVVAWMAWIFVLRLPAWPVFGLVGKADSHLFFFLT